MTQQPVEPQPPDTAGMDARMDAIRLKQILGHPLSEHELMCLQIEQNGFGCAPCSTGRTREPPVDHLR